MTIAHSAPITFDLAAHSFTPTEWSALCERYQNKVNKRGPDDCWPWTGPHTRRGYGLLKVKRHTTGAHRLGFLIHYGTLDPLLDVLHSCDFPPCQNWAHWRQGTHQENMAERDRKGRLSGQVVPRGEQSHMAKLTEVQIHAIRRMYATGNWTHRTLGVQFNVSGVAIHYILSGHTWSHVAPKPYQLELWTA